MTQKIDRNTIVDRKARTANIGLAIWRLKCSYKTIVQGSTAVILLNICTKNPPHRQATKRYMQAVRPFTIRQTVDIHL